MQIEQNDKGVEKILNRADRGRILAMFSVVDQLDPSDIIKITGLLKNRVSEALTDLEGLSYLKRMKSDTNVFWGNSKDYFILYPANSVITKQKMQKFMFSEEFKKDRAKILNLLLKGELAGVKKQASILLDEE